MSHYTYRAEWAPELGEYVGRCIELPELTGRAPTMRAALLDLEAAVEQYLADREASGYPIPRPLTERTYSGTFVVRTSPALHARLAVEAAEQNVSMNQWVVQRLADRPPSPLLDW